ncbi:MAG TPA: YciI family protein [Candidatus Limnocylindria bacterium]|nr:YciI family protein [Candidatus Limnocylindria bacterium]
MSKFVLIVNFQGGAVDTPMEEWKPEEVQAHLDYYRALNAELRASGELLETAVLAGPDVAKVVTSNGKGAPVVTDGPFQEFKEWLAGYQIVDVESEARALEIAGRISAVPGPNGVPLEQPIQVRELMESSPRTTAEMADWLETVGGTR